MTNMDLEDQEFTSFPPSEGNELVATLTGWSNAIFLVSSMIALLMDPLFLYIPIVDEQNKCLLMDKKLRTVSLLLRSFGDITFILHVVYQIRQFFKAKAQTSGGEYFNLHDKLPKRSIIADFLAVLPIPQVIILSVFFRIRGSGYLDHGGILNFLLFAQYLPRIYQTRHLCAKIANTSGLIVKVLFYFFVYILLCHVSLCYKLADAMNRTCSKPQHMWVVADTSFLYAPLKVVGAFWYFFAIQREMSCWYQATVKHSKSKISFYCDDSSSRNITLLNQFCPIKSPDATVFDFGIFLDSLQSNNKGSIDFPAKLLFSIWWAMRNLSSFGQNLVTSNLVWENCFAIIISLSLPVFSLVGYYVQNLPKINEARRKTEEKKSDLEEWMSRNNLPEEFRKEIMRNIRRKLEEDNDIHADLTVVSLLPWYIKKGLKRFLCMRTLKKVPRLVGKEERVLKMMCDNLKPVMYMENSYIIRAGEPLDFMLLVTEGTILIYTAGNAPSLSTRSIEKGDCYGDEILSWAALHDNASFSTLPISLNNVKCHTKVEGFILMAKDLKTIVSKCGNLWYNHHPDETICPTETEI